MVISRGNQPIICFQLKYPENGLDTGIKTFIDLFTFIILQGVSAGTPYGIITDNLKAFCVKLEQTDEWFRNAMECAERYRNEQSHRNEVLWYRTVRNTDAKYNLSVVLTAFVFAERGFSNHSKAAEFKRLDYERAHQTYSSEIPILKVTFKESDFEESSLR